MSQGFVESVVIWIGRSARFGEFVPAVSISSSVEQQDSDVINPKKKYE